MSGRDFTIFDATSRKPVRSVTCHPDKLSRYVREGHVVVPGRHRGAVCLNEADEPVADEQRASAVTQERRRTARMTRIEELERLRSRRAERELLLAIAEELGLQSTEAYTRLKAIAEEIETLRADLLDRSR